MIIFIFFFFPKKQRWRLITHANAKSKSEKFPPPHQDGALGFPMGSSHYMDPCFDPPDVPFSSTLVYQKGQVSTWSGPLVDPATVGHVKRKKTTTAANARVPVHMSKTEKWKGQCLSQMERRSVKFSLPELVIATFFWYMVSLIGWEHHYKVRQNPSFSFPFVWFFLGGLLCCGL